MSDQPVDLPGEDIRAESHDGAAARANAARSWVVLLISDLSWMVGAAEGGGNEVPSRITDNLGAALNWLAEP